jgi:fucose permease
VTEPGLIPPPGISPVDPAPRGFDRPVVLLAPVAYVALGMVEITLSIAWKPIAEELGRRAADIGFLLVAFATGYVTAALSQHRLSRRWATPVFVLIASALGAIGAALYVTSSVLAVLALGSLCFGVSAASIDTALGSYVAIRHGPRAIGVMAGGFGVGALLGPGLITVVLAAGGSWRVAYGVLAVFEVSLFIGWWLLRRRFDPDRSTPLIDAGRADDAPSASVVSHVVAPRRGLVPVLLATYFTYVGTEQAFGVWAFWLLSARGTDDDRARLVLTGYWAAITLGRFVIAGAASRVPPRRVLTIGTTLAVGAAVAIWFGGATIAAGALVVAGLGLAGVFPSLVALTPVRLGVERTRAVMGRQMAAASLGGAAIPALIGVVQQRSGAAAIGPSLVVVTATLFVLHRGGLALDPRRAGAVVPRG